MLANFRHLVKKHHSEISLLIGIILIALISFATGRLTAQSTEQASIIIQGPTASLEQSLTAETEEENEKEVEGEFVGSSNSNKYHWPECPWAKKIAPQNQIWFSSEKEAQAAGYIRCGYFEKYAP